MAAPRRSWSGIASSAVTVQTDAGVAVPGTGGAGKNGRSWVGCAGLPS